MSPVGYRHCFLWCKSPKHCAIPIPHSSLPEIDGSLRQATTADRKVVVLCPYCGLVSAYSARDIVEHLRPDTPSLFQSSECHVAAIEAECDGESCKAPKVIHVILGDEKGTWRPTVALKDWTFSESACCEAGHKLRLEESGKYLWTNLNELPF
jgi:hypothetical protein